MSKERERMTITMHHHFLFAVRKSTTYVCVASGRTSSLKLTLTSLRMCLWAKNTGIKFRALNLLLSMQSQHWRLNRNLLWLWQWLVTVKIKLIGKLLPILSALRDQKKRRKSSSSWTKVTLKVASNSIGSNRSLQICHRRLLNKAI